MHILKSLLYPKSAQNNGLKKVHLLARRCTFNHHQRKGADVVVINMPLLDKRREKTLLGTFISDLILALLSYVAETEYQTIHQRQAEGIAAAKARGVKLGRPSRPLPENFHEVYQRWKAENISTEEVARLVTASSSPALKLITVSCSIFVNLHIS